MALCALCGFRATVQVEVLTSKYGTLVGKLESRTQEMGRQRQRAADSEAALDASQAKLAAALHSHSEKVRCGGQRAGRVLASGCWLLAAGCGCWLLLACERVWCVVCAVWCVLLLCAVLTCESRQLPERLPCACCVACNLASPYCPCGVGGGARRRA